MWIKGISTIDEIREIVGGVMFVQFGKDVKSHLELLEILKRVTCTNGKAA